MKVVGKIIPFAIVLLPVLLQAEIIKDYGLMFAYTSANTEVDKFEDFSARRSGFNIGFSTEWFETSVLSILLRIEYTQKGYILEMVEVDEDGEEIQTVQANTRLDYLSIPLLTKIKGMKLISEPYIAVGPRVDILVNKKTGKFEFTTVTLEEPYTDYFDNYAFGVTIAFGLSLPKISIFKPDIELDYNFDLTDSFSSLKTLEAKNNSFDLWLIFSIK